MPENKWLEFLKTGEAKVCGICNNTGRPSGEVAVEDLPGDGFCICPGGRGIKDLTAQ